MQILGDDRTVLLQTDLINRKRLAALPFIRYVDCAPEPGEPEDREGRALHRVDGISENYKEGLFFDGEGVGVLVRDDGPVGPHIDFHGENS